MGMSISLDDERAMVGLDRSSMLRQMSELPDQIEASLSLSPPPKQHAIKMCLCGLGGSAMGADILVSHLEQNEGVMGAVVRDVTLPRWVDSETLAVLISYSGNTRETISMYNEARRRGAKMVAVTSGGTLEKMCRENDVPLVMVPAGLQPRAALGYMLGALAVVADTTGASSIRGDLTTMLPALQDRVRECSSTTPTDRNPAKTIARQLQGSVPFIYSSRNLKAAGHRWLAQINENGKMLGHCAELPEADHNEVVGWVDGSRNAQCRPVILRSPSDKGMMDLIVNATLSIFEDFALSPIVVDLRGSSVLESIMDGVVVGDHVSFYLAMLNGVDPTPVSSINELKKRLG